MARGHHHSSHHGKHHVAHHGGKMAVHHHYKKGGEVDTDKGALEYTAHSNVIPESEGERRKRGGRKADGGGVALKHGGSVHHGKHHVAHHGSEHVEHHHHADGGAVALARGGRPKKHVEMEGHKSRMRLDRPGRKRGGGVGSDMTPLTSAARVREAGAHKADNDELEE